MCINKLLIDSNISVLSAVEVERRAFQFLHSNAMVGKN